MTYPGIELLCPRCKEPMTLVDTLALTHGGDVGVEFHFKCGANKRHAGKWHRWSMDLHKPVIYKGEIGTDGEPTEINEKNCGDFSKESNWCEISTDEEIAIFRIIAPR